MGIRRKAREQAMQALFYMDMQQCADMDLLERFRGNFPLPKDTHPFFHTLTNGVLENRERIDRIIEAYSSHWKIDRMSCVDRNVLRIAIYEMLFCPDIPTKVSINEAIEVGKKFGTEESGAFINGILDSFRHAIDSKDARLMRILESEK